MNPKTLQIHPNDNVLVALQDLSAGESVFMGDFELTVKEDIPAKHKLAIQSFEKNQEVIMYGLLVGKATQAIPAGGLLSTENIKHQAADFKINSSTYQWEKPDVSRFEKRQKPSEKPLLKNWVLPKVILTSNWLGRWLILSKKGI